MKLHLVFLSAFASLTAAAVAGNSQDIAPPFTEEPGGVEKRDNIESPPSSMWSMQCNNFCERDLDCCQEDKCSSDKRCEGYWSETFPFGYPLHEAVNYSDPADVDHWSKLSMEQNKAQWLNIPSTSPQKRDNVKDLSSTTVATNMLSFKGLIFSRECSRPCERDSHCCGSDTCSTEHKRCKGLYDERFPKGYPLGQEIDWSNSTDVDYWSKLSMEQDKAHGLDNPSTPPEKRDDVKDPTPSEKPMIAEAYQPEIEFEPLPAEILPDFKPTAKWSPPCKKTCERDIDCCYTDKCSKDKKCEGLFDEKFPKGYPMSHFIDYSNDTVVEYWSKWSLDEDRIELEAFDSGVRADH